MLQSFPVGLVDSDDYRSMEGDMPQKKTASERRNPEIGTRLARARKKMGYTQAQMGEMFGISDVAWRNYEKGRELKSDMIIQICAVLECSPNWLLGYHDTGMSLTPDSLLLKQLKAAFDVLNGQGQQEAVKRVQELAHVPRYVGEEKSFSTVAGA